MSFFDELDDATRDVFRKEYEAGMSEFNDDCPCMVCYPYSGSERNAASSSPISWSTWEGCRMSVWGLTTYRLRRPTRSRFT